MMKRVSTPRRNASPLVLSLLLLIGLLVAAWLRLGHHEPERLTESSLLRSGSFVIADQQVYAIKPLQGAMNSATSVSAQGIALSTLPVTGGRERLLATDPINGRLENLVGPAADVATQLLYRDHALVYAVTSPYNRPPGDQTPRIQGRFAGVFLLTKPPSAQSVERWKSRNVRYFLRWKPPETHLRRLPLPTGPIQDVARIQGYTRIVVGGYLYWIRPALDEEEWITQGAETYLAIRGHSELMVTSLAGGETQRVGVGLSLRASLFAGAEGVFWTEPHGYPDTRVDLYSARPSQPTKRLIARDIAPLSNPLQEYKGRLYLVEPHRRLVAQNLDGSQSHTLHSLAQDHQFLAMSPHIVGSNLYFIVQDQPEGKRQAHTYLYRVGTSSMASLKQIGSVTGAAHNFQFDADYLYFTRRETHHSLWNGLSEDDIHGGETETLCRIPLSQ